MPTYQYRCTSCDTELEKVQKFSDEPLTVCPECNGSLRKVFSAVGVVFKGSGFYATDNRPKGKHGAGKSGEKSGDKHGEKSGEKHHEKHGEKSESKHGEKSEPKSGEKSSEHKPKSSEAKPASSTGASSAA